MALSQTVIQDIKKSLETTHLDEKIYWISTELLWYSIKKVLDTPKATKSSEGSENVGIS